MTVQKASKLMTVKVLVGNWKGYIGTSDGERTERGNWLVVTVPRIPPWVNPPDKEQTIKIALQDGEYECVND